MAIRGDGNNTINGAYGSDAESQMLQQLAQSLASSGGETSSGLVYMGQQQFRPSGNEEHGSTLTQDNWMNADEAALQYNSWSRKKRQDFVAQAKIGGLLSPEGGEVEGAQLWRMLVEEASYYGINQDKKVSPWDILSSYVEQSGASGEWVKDPSDPNFEVNRLTGERRYVGPQFETTTQTNFDYSDPATARAIATSIWQQMMGRDPGAGELEKFAAALHSAESSSPVIASTTTEYDPVTGEAVNSTTETTGGMTDTGRAYLAENRVKGTQEYADVQAGTTYANALEEMVWGSPSLGSA